MPILFLNVFFYPGAKHGHAGLNGLADPVPMPLGILQPCLACWNNHILLQHKLTYVYIFLLNVFYNIVHLRLLSPSYVYKPGRSGLPDFAKLTDPNV